jgi:uncharacterized protein
MQEKITLKLLPSEAADEAIVKKYIASSAKKSVESISGYKILKKSIDARGKTIFINLTVEAFFGELEAGSGQFAKGNWQFANVENVSKTVIIYWSRASGYFCSINVVGKRYQTHYFRKRKRCTSKAKRSC